MRDKYVMTMTNANECKIRRIVYMDESYIHKNYCRHDDSLYDPNDEQDLTTVAAHKGQRYCFIAAIIDADHSLPLGLRHPKQNAHILTDTVDIFEGGKKQTKDYHGMFNHDYFVVWMGKLLQCLKDRGIYNAIIVMDNAKYHKKLPEECPRARYKKAILQEACDKYNIPYDDTEDTKAVIWQLLRRYIRDNIPPVIVKMASDAGHELLYSPPHYSDLQPIELVWAIIKGEVGRQYTTETTFSDVLIRLQKAIGNLNSRSIQGCINKANNNLKSLRKDLETIEDCNDDDDDSDYDGSDDTDTDDDSSCSE